MQSISEIPNDYFYDLMIMNADGLIGHRGSWYQSATICAMMANLMGQSPPLKAEKIFPWIFEYDQAALTPEQKTQRAQTAMHMLLMNAPGFETSKLAQIVSGEPNGRAH